MTVAYPIRSASVPTGCSAPGPRASCSGLRCIVVDVGTATTIDVVDAEGTFVGGAIMPGPGWPSGRCAAPRCCRRCRPSCPERAIGRDTVEAIQSGVVLGHLAAIGWLVTRMTEELAGSIEPTVVILTGGGSTALGSIDASTASKRTSCSGAWGCWPSA